MRVLILPRPFRHTNTADVAAACSRDPLALSLLERDFLSLNEVPDSHNEGTFIMELSACHSILIVMGNITAKKFLRTSLFHTTIPFLPVSSCLIVVRFENWYLKCS